MRKSVKKRLGALRDRVLGRAPVWLRWFLVGGILLSLFPVIILRWVPPPASAVMLWRALEQRAWPAYHWVPMERIAPVAGLAVVAAEDQRFPDHAGFDLDEIGNAVNRYFEGGRLRGASTLSQQVAKNLFLWEGRSLVRKGLEAWMTALLELLWSKQRILEVYLNIAEMGTGVFGVEAASQRFFRHPAQRLSAGEAALLAAALPSPRQRRVEAPSADLLARRDWVLRQMRQLGGVEYLDGL